MSKDINLLFYKAEDAKDTDDKDWEVLEGKGDNGTTQKINNHTQQAKSISVSSSFSRSSPFLFSFSLSLFFPT